MDKPTISIVSLIYQSPEYATSVYDSLHKHTPELSDGQAEFFFVANDATQNVINHLKNNNYSFKEFHAKNLTPEELFAQGYAYPEYITRVYKAWNFAIQQSKGDIICLVNSDHFFSPNWLDKLLKHLTPERIIVPTIVESRPLGGWVNVSLFNNFGNSPTNYRENDFIAYCNHVSQSHSGLKIGVGCGEYMPCLFYKTSAEKVNFYPEGNIAGLNYNTIQETGDKNFFRKLLEQENIEHVRVLDTLIYHLTEGEMHFV